MKKYGTGLLLALLFFSCAKEGTDGEATLVVKLRHHAWSIYSSPNYKDSVFVKFGAKEVPADPTHDYDALFTGEDSEDHVHCEKMKWGYYSVYCTGYDTVMHARVTGGVTTKITRSERKEEIDLTVPLVE